MRLSRSDWFLTALLGYILAVCVGSFVQSPTSIPKQLLREEGVVASAEATHSKGGISAVRFTVMPSGRTFLHHSILRGTHLVWDAIEVGSKVQVSYASEEDPDLWGLAIDRNVFLTPEQTLAGYRENSLWALALGSATLLGLLYMLFIRGRRYAA